MRLLPIKEEEEEEVVVEDTGRSSRLVLEDLENARILLLGTEARLDSPKARRSGLFSDPKKLSGLAASRTD